MAKKSSNSSGFRLKGVAQTVAQEKSQMPKYLERRGNVFWFRRRAPSPLKAHDKLELDDRLEAVHANGYVRFSLSTSDSKVAATLARKYAHLVDAAAEAAITAVQVVRASELRRKRNEHLTPFPRRQFNPGAPTTEEIRFAAESMYAELLMDDERIFKESMQAAFDGEDDGELLPNRYSWSTAELPPRTPKGEATLIQAWWQPIMFALYQHTGKTVDGASAALLPFADTIRRFVSAMEQRRESTGVPSPPKPHKGQVWTWNEAFEYYFKQRAHLSKATQDNYRIAWNSLASFAKGVPAALKREVVVEWRDQMLSDVARLTAKNRLTFAAAIWRESKSNGKISLDAQDPFAELRVRIGTNSGTSRKEYSTAELKTLFAAESVSTARGVSEHAGYWLPLLALYHGGRLEELTGLEVRDVEDWDESLIIHIRENSIRPKLKHGKHSERSTPVHPKLIELGFKNYVSIARAAGVERLFPSFTRGATFGEAYVAHAKSLLKPEAGRIVGMHCFRHCWESARRNGRLDASAAQYITGRKMENGSASDYGGPAGLDTLLTELAKINYPLTFLPAPEVSEGELKTQDLTRIKALRAKQPQGKAKTARVTKHPTAP